MELLKLEYFLKELQESWKIAKKLMEMAKKAIKKQFNKKRQNSQELKEKNNMWLEAKNIYLNQLSKKLNQKKYRLFKISKNIKQKCQMKVCGVGLEMCRVCNSVKRAW